MTTLDDLRANVGVERFAEAQRWAWQTAANTGRALSVDEIDTWPEEVAGVPHDLADAVWFDEQLSSLERVQLHFTLYRVMPCYANLMYADLDRLDEEALDMFWLNVRKLLDDEDDRLGEPVAYWLWCGPFEDAGQAAQAWNQTISGRGVGDRGFARALAVSGPVPWEAKAPLLRKLFPDTRWHRAIFHCIRGSALDTFGDVDVVEAKALLDGLKLKGHEAEAAHRVREELARQ
jgi:hypothetical protein